MKEPRIPLHIRDFLTILFLTISFSIFASEFSPFKLGFNLNHSINVLHIFYLALPYHPLMPDDDPQHQK